MNDAPPDDADNAETSESGRRHWARRVVGGVLLVSLLVAVGLFLGFRRQTVSYLTHWKGGPENSVRYEALEPEPLLHLAAIGDVGDSGTSRARIADAMTKVGDSQPIDSVLFLGDNVYPDGDPDRTDETIFTPFGPVFEQGAQLHAILGNHDVIGYDGSEQMDVLGMDGRYWSADLGEVLLIGLDSNRIDDPVQIEWLEETLRTSTHPWKIVALHHPPYSAGYQGSDLAVRRAMAPIFVEYGVQLVLSGHDHDYQRSETIDGVTYVVSGAGSGTRRTGEDDFTAESFSWLHFLDVAVYSDRIVVRPVNDELRVADEVVLRR